MGIWCGSMQTCTNPNVQKLNLKDKENINPRSEKTFEATSFRYAARASTSIANLNAGHDFDALEGHMSSARTPMTTNATPSSMQKL